MRKSNSRAPNLPQARIQQLRQTGQGTATPAVSAAGKVTPVRQAPTRQEQFGEINAAALNDMFRAVPYRDAVCTLCEKTVALAFDIPVDRFQARTRCSAEVALARQIAMYLSHTIFSLLLTEVGLHFHRDRTTVSHACAMVEDKRDEMEFDVLLTQLESLLIEARNAMALSLGEILHHRQAMDEMAMDEAPVDDPAEAVPEPSVERKRA